MLRNVQALRAIAALLVVVVHLAAMGAVLGIAGHLFDMFAVGVDLFFVISGFIMVHTTSGKTVAPWAFLANRLLRIAPIYWLLTLLLFGVALMEPGLLGTTRAAWDALFRSLTFIPYERADGTFRPILFVGWSLNMEMAFYLVFALALMLAGTGRRVAFGVAALVLAVAMGIALGPVLPVELRFLTQPILLEFAAGMVIGWLYPCLPSSPQLARWAAMAGALGMVALLLVARWPLPGGWPLSAAPACLVVIAALVAEKGGLSIGSRTVQSLGDASYALYLTHPFVTQAWIIAAQRTGMLTPASAPLLMALAITSAAVVAVLFHRRVERPLNRLVRQTVAQIGIRSRCAAGLSEAS